MFTVAYKHKYKHKQQQKYFTKDVTVLFVLFGIIIIILCMDKIKIKQESEMLV